LLSINHAIMERLSGAGEGVKVEVEADKRGGVAGVGLGWLGRQHCHEIDHLQEGGAIQSNSCMSWRICCWSATRAAIALSGESGIVGRRGMGVVRGVWGGTVVWWGGV